jgi:transcriptional regulator with XRE-family HTH domain
MQIGRRIRERRIALGLSVDELAEKLGKNRATIYRYEGDEIENFPVSVIEPLADALLTTPAYLMGWTDNPSGGKTEEDDTWTLRQEEREDPDRKALFMLSKYGSAKDIRQVNALMEALKATNPDFYDGDDPA